MRYIFQYEYPRLMVNKLDKDPSKIFNKNFIKKNLKDVPRSSFKLSNLVLKNSILSPSLKTCLDNTSYVVYIEIDNEELALYLSMNPTDILNPSKKKFTLKSIISIDEETEEKISNLSSDTNEIADFLKKSESFIDNECRTFAALTNIPYSKRNYFGITIAHPAPFAVNLREFNDLVLGSYNAYFNNTYITSVYRNIMVEAVEKSFIQLKDKVDPLIDERKESYSKLSNNLEILSELIKRNKNV